MPLTLSANPRYKVSLMRFYMLVIGLFIITILTISYIDYFDYHRPYKMIVSVVGISICTALDGVIIDNFTSHVTRVAQANMMAREEYVELNRLAKSWLGQPDHSSPLAAHSRNFDEVQVFAKNLKLVNRFDTLFSKGL